MHKMTKEGEIIRTQDIKLTLDRTAKDASVVTQCMSIQFATIRFQQLTLLQTRDRFKFQHVIGYILTFQTIDVSKVLLQPTRLANN